MGLDELSELLISSLTSGHTIDVLHVCVLSIKENGDTEPIFDPFPLKIFLEQQKSFFFFSSSSLNLHLCQKKLKPATCSEMVSLMLCYMQWGSLVKF